MLDRPPEKSVTQRDIREFLDNIAKLAALRVSGLPTLADHLYLSWKREVGGEPNATMLGFLIEARAAVSLHAAGYTILGMSQRKRGGYEYDILAQTPSRKNCAIEVKTTIGTISLKNAGLALGGERVAESQLYRFAQAAKVDELEPVVAVWAEGRDASWGYSAAGHVLDAIRSAAGIRPTVIWARDGRALTL